MSSNFKELLELIFITANQIAYPQKYPANRSQKEPPTSQRKYPFWDYRNLTDNQGWLKINIDYSQYKPKKYYIDASEQVIENHLKALQKKQNLLKKFKYHQDFDRIDYKNAERPITLQNNIEKQFVYHFAVSALLSRFFMVQQYYSHFSFTLWRKSFFKIYFTTLPVFFAMNLFLQHANPINHQFFRSNTAEMRVYQGIAYDVDGYKDVNDIKYNFQYPEREQFTKTVWQIWDKKAKLKYEDSIKYYKRLYGIVDPEPFWNKTKNHSENSKN